MTSVSAARPEVEGALDEPGFADNAIVKGEELGLALAQRAHDLEALYRDVRRPSAS